MRKNLTDLSLDCQCTDEYQLNGADVGAFCKDWSGVGFSWCYLKGASNAAECPDAIKSRHGDYYWSKHPTVCKPRGTNE